MLRLDETGEELGPLCSLLMLVNRMVNHIIPSKLFCQLHITCTHATIIILNFCLNGQYLRVTPGEAKCSKNDFLFFGPGKGPKSLRR